MHRLVFAFAALLFTLPSTTARLGAQEAPRNLVAEVRASIAKDDFPAAERTVADAVKTRGTTPEVLEAMSWLGRGALAKKQLDAAQKYAGETYALSQAALKGRKLDDEPRLPIALGAAIEVQAHVMAARGQLSEAVYFLQRELEEYRGTSIRTRLNKNINLLSLEGKPAPAYETAEWIGDRKPPTLQELRGKPVLLFFWAHWCGDCKSMAGTLAELKAAYRDQGLEIVAPTQRYGYVAKRAPADARTEFEYIGQVVKEFYSAIDWTAPLSNESFSGYGSSTTPTIVLVDRAGIVRLYHPGQMSRAELEPHIKALVRAATNSQDRD